MGINDGNFSVESQNLERSVMRELIQIVAKPDVISLAGGLPDSALLPTEQLRESFSTVLTEIGGDALQYRPQFPPLVEWIVEYMRSRGVDCTPEQIFITNGNQQGLTIISRLFLDPGKVAVTEEIVFTGVQQATKGRGAEMRTIPTDLISGADVDALEAAFMQEPRPRLAVVIPDYHNPLGVSLTQEKRIRIAELGARYGVPIIEDDPYSALRFEGVSSPPIKAFDEAGFVFYMGSFSKMLAPAARLGWMVAPKELVLKLTVIKESIDLESSALTQRAVADFLINGHLPAHLDRLNAVNQERCNIMLETLDEHFGDIATWTKPEGGLFIWMTLNADIDTWALLETAVNRRVAYIPGSAFAVHGGYKNTIRLNFSKVPPDLIRTGVERLAGVIREAL
jgi:2-aminoadipate transaminase